MKNIFILFFFLCFSLIFANPLVSHIDITEFIFTETGWQMELYSDFFEEENLDNCYITCAAGSSFVAPGFEFWGYTYMVITENDLQAPLTINEEGDCVSFIYTQGESYNFSFGTLEDMVLAPAPGQSLQAIGLSTNGWETTDIVFAKDNTPSLGSADDGSGFRGTFCGYVYDSLMNPVENALIDHTPDCISLPDIITDMDGYFEVELYAFNYDCHVHLLNLATVDSLISIEPDSINFYEFVFPCYVHSDDYEIELPASQYHLSNHPNPFNPSTVITFQLPADHGKVELSIYNAKGQTIKTYPIAYSTDYKEYSQNWDGTDHNLQPVDSGVYFCRLVSAGKELATQKMLLLK